MVRSQLDLHAAYGGVVPEIAARAHVELLDAAILQALAEAGLGFDAIDAVAATAGPGLIGGLIVGVTMGKAIALGLGEPFIAVNHLEAHALTARLTDGLDFPYLLLLVSGGHTQMLSSKDVGAYRAARHDHRRCARRGLRQGGQAARPCLSRRPGDRATWPRVGNATVKLPRPMLGRPGPHFSLAGLKTALRHEALARAPLGEQDVADIAASFQAAVADIVADRTARAIAIYTERLPAQARRACWSWRAGSRPTKAIKAALEKLAARTVSAWSCRRLRSAPTMPR